MNDREFATDVVTRLQRAGHQTLWAGGCVRDELLGLPPADYDVATAARPDQVQALFRRCLAIGASFGVVEVLGPRGSDGEWLKVQVATFRADGTYSDGRRPDAVTFSSPEEDARRRDFTINGMFLDPLTNQVTDYVGGRADLDAKVLRAIGDPAARFAEDKLRTLRAVRMAARFDLTVDPATLAAAQQVADEIGAVSPERIADEFRKMLAHPTRARTAALLREFQLIGPVLPELAGLLDGIAEPPSRRPHGSIWGHVLGCLEGLPPQATFPLAFAAVLNVLGPANAIEVCRRMRLSNAESDRVGWLVGTVRVIDDAPAMRPSRLYPLLVHPGIEELLLLHRAEAVAAGRSVEPVEFCKRVLRATPPAVLNPPPLLTGDDLRAHGLKPGPSFKRLLDAVRVAQLDGQARSHADGVALVETLLANGTER